MQETLEYFDEKIKLSRKFLHLLRLLLRFLLLLPLLRLQVMQILLSDNRVRFVVRELSLKGRQLTDVRNGEMDVLTEKYLSKIRT